MSVSTPAKRIGIFGGSFDPPHLGHEALVHAALEKLALDEVWVIPAGVPVHRELSVCADAAQRLAWANTMFADVARARVMDWESGQPGPVAAIDTLRRFGQHCPQVIPLWLCGADSYASMPGWVDYPAHRALCNVAVFARAGEQQAEVLEGWKLLSCEQWLEGSKIGPGHVIRVDVELPDVSATRVRELAGRGESLQGLVNSRICEEVESRYGAGAGE